ncbi:TIGR04104 family putative zinc finger protein [Peribacillus frigoritolerans]|uniref:TIGR04104 family putative zinc finger protein n=1 Tax=Peribacillus frigoritolerans TaxID=450367 RepID=UPI003335ACA5
MISERGVFLGIQKCETCGYQFTWREVQKAIRWTYKPLVCRKCGTKHKVTMQTRLLLALLSGVIVLILIVSKVPFYLGTALVIILPLTVILFFPYFAKYKANHKQ